MTGEDGGQLRANITRELDNGYVRLSFKHLDDKTPMNMPVPVKTVNGTISEIAGIDPRKASFYSPYWVKDIVLDKNNNRIATNINDGLHVTTNAIGAEASLNFSSCFFELIGTRLNSDSVTLPSEHLWHTIRRSSPNLHLPSSVADSPT